MSYLFLRGRTGGAGIAASFLHLSNAHLSAAKSKNYEITLYAA